MIMTKEVKAIILKICANQQENEKLLSTFFSQESKIVNSIKKKVIDADEFSEIEFSINEYDLIMSNLLSLLCVFMNTKECPKCNNIVVDYSKYCQYCGFVFPSKIKLCIDIFCSEINDEDAIYCKKCGKKLALDY